MPHGKPPSACSISIAFFLCLFEFVSLTWFSLVPLNEAGRYFFPLGDNATFVCHGNHSLHNKSFSNFQTQAACVGFAFSTVSIKS
eukprot:m.145164 g.145164  ORF g.145164 m.145164 type:complete len:85 (+) comp14940_c0_seq1:111-365(+)